MGGEPLRLVVLSDTHGRLPGRVRDACAGAGRIVHAGDVGSEDILAELEAAAPVTAVSGNVDPAARAPARARVEAGGWRIVVQHIVWERGGPSAEMRDHLAQEGADLVVFGHTHEPLCRRVGEAVYLNPGSCGPRRFSLPQTYAEVELGAGAGRFRILRLDEPPGAPPLIAADFPLRRG